MGLKSRSQFLKRENTIQMARWLGRQRDRQVRQIGRQMIGRNIRTYIHADIHTHIELIWKRKPVKSQYVKGRELRRNENFCGSLNSKKKEKREDRRQE